MANVAGFQADAPRGPGENAEQREKRLAWERKAIDEARAQVRAGHVISGAELDALLDRYDAEDGVKLPPSAKP